MVRAEGRVRGRRLDERRGGERLMLSVVGGLREGGGRGSSESGGAKVAGRGSAPSQVLSSLRGGLRSLVRIELVDFLLMLRSLRRPGGLDAKESRVRLRPCVSAISSSNHRSLSLLSSPGELGSGPGKRRVDFGGGCGKPSPLRVVGVGHLLIPEERLGEQ
jgi:hypothetical protein